MIFQVEKTDIDLDYTLVDNIFIENYLPIAKGDYVKVYLYSYKNRKAENLDNEKIASNLQLTLTDVEKAWDYWEKEEIIEKDLKLDGSYDIRFVNIKKYYFDNINGARKKPEKTKTQNLVDSMNNQSIRNMFTNIDYFMRRQTTPTEKLEILSWVSDYNMGPEMIEVAFEYCVEKKHKTSVKYVKAVVISWYDKGLTSLEEIEEEIKKSDEKYIRKNQILRKLGLQYRAVSEPEINLINSWFDDYKFSEGLIDEALKRTSQIQKPSINYVNSILLKWKKLGIDKVEDIEEKDLRPIQTKNPSQNKFNNFTGQSRKYTAEELNQMAKNMRKRRQKDD